MFTHDGKKFSVNDNGTVKTFEKVGVIYNNMGIQKIGESEAVFQDFCVNKKRETLYCQENNVKLHEASQIHYIEFNLDVPEKNDYVCEELNKVIQHPPYWNQLIWNLKSLIKE